jgi:uncharacterized protein YbjT (DUF2867 family)
MARALEGADTLYLIPAHRASDRIELHAAVIRAATAAGVRRIVYLSFLGAAADATFHRAREHWHTEECIRASSASWTFLRMNLYADFLPTMVGADGVIRGPAGDGRLSAVLRDDVALASVAVLVSDGHDGRSYDLTGPRALSLADVAETMRGATGKNIRFHDESDAEAFASRASLGADWEIEGWVSSYRAIRDGSLSPINADFRRLTGRQPGSLADYLRAHPDVLDHVK